MARKGKDRGSLPLEKLGDVLTSMSRVLKEESEAATAPTALCTAHVPNEEKPLECAKCGKPLLRQSEERLEADVVAVEAGEWQVDEWASVDPARTPPEVRQLAREVLDAAAAGGAVLTPERLDAVLDADEDLRLDWLTVVIEQPWLDRLKALAAKAGMSEPKYIEQLIKRQWIASGGGKS